MEKALLTIQEAGKMLSISRSQVYRLIANRELEVIHIGRAVRVPVGEIERWVQTRTRSTGP
ncbi:MAG: helix-turn-helix domain-containing protein [Chloroflexi bacterium]|nr:helix-turn-helix domain-containing protein [Chloroflexota bacterium]